MPTVDEIRTRSAEARKRKERFQAWQSPTWEDIDLLLFLLDSDSQAAGGSDDMRRDSTGLESIDEYFGGCTCGAEQRNQAFLTQYNLLESAATSMRDKCVAKVKAVKSKWAHKPVLTHSALDEAISALESLTFDQVKPGEM